MNGLLASAGALFAPSDQQYLLQARLLVSAGLTIFADSGWAHAVGVAGLFAFAASAFVFAASRPDDRAEWQKGTRE